MKTYTDIVFDKTGTITVKEDRSIEFVGDELNDPEWIALVNIAKQSGHPLSIAIAEKYSDNSSLDPVQEYLEEIGKGISGLSGGLNVSLGNAAFAGTIDNVSNINETRVYLSINEKSKGFFRFKNQYRKGFDEVAKLLAVDRELHLLSGDNDSETQRLSRVFTPENLHFDLKPDDKSKWIHDRNEEGKRVLMIGDGLNDAGALKESFFGISVADDVHQFTPASDAILHSTAFNRLPAFIKLSAQARVIVWIAFGISLTYNIVGMSVAVQGILSPIFAAILMPLSSVSIVLFTTITSGIIARLTLKD